MTVVLDTEHEVTCYQDSPFRPTDHTKNKKRLQRRWISAADGNVVAHGRTDGGVYVQSEVVSLTRHIPTGLGWLIEPFITSLPKESLEFTLGATQKAVLAERRE